MSLASRKVIQQLNKVLVGYRKFGQHARTNRHHDEQG